MAAAHAAAMNQFLSWIGSAGMAHRLPPLPVDSRTALLIVGFDTVSTFLYFGLLGGAAAAGRDVTWSAEMPLALGLMGAALLLPLWLVRLPARAGLAAFGFRRTTCSGLVLGAAAALAYCRLVYGAQDGELDWASWHEAWHEVPVFMAGRLLTTVAMAPLVEELVYRGIVFAGLAARWGALPAVLASAVLFSAAHIGSLEAFWFRFGSGVILALLYLWSRSLWVPFAAHASNNLLAEILNMVAE